MMRNRFHFISLAVVMFFGLESVAAADTFRIRLTGTRCADDPACHNRFHPAIKPVITVKPGDTVMMETRDAFDGQITPTSTAADVIPTGLGGPLNLNRVHPLTGPVAIQGAEPGDLLVVHIVDIISDDFAYTINVPGFGFLRSEVPGPAILHWDIKGDVATSRDLPGVRIHAEPSMGTTGIALSVAKTEEVFLREHELAGRGGFVLEPLEADAVPASVCGHGGTFASRCLRTIPTRENAGNIDVKQLTKGGRLLIPVFVPGALFSAGDAHFAQGDGEIAGTTMEMNVTLVVKFTLRKGEARRQNITTFQFERDNFFAPPERAVPKRFFATTGISVNRVTGKNESEDLTLSARNAALNMIDHLVRNRGLTRQQAYMLSSTAVDLHINQLVDVPNFLVSAFLHLDVFGDGDRDEDTNEDKK
ncbi:MAG TPA: acetamidase/formamidase family protein [Burkholderiales bacterium]|nr:acetamidase/formamidase family protein [Burkholderiales bacterium]